MIVINSNIGEYLEARKNKQLQKKMQNSDFSLFQHLLDEEIKKLGKGELNNENNIRK